MKPGFFSSDKIDLSTTRSGEICIKPSHPPKLPILSNPSEFLALPGWKSGSCTSSAAGNAEASSSGATASLYNFPIPDALKEILAACQPSSAAPLSSHVASVNASQNTVFSYVPVVSGLVAPSVGICSMPMNVEPMLSAPVQCNDSRNSLIEPVSNVTALPPTWKSLFASKPRNAVSQ